MSVTSGRCEYHPQRPGLGVCVECRKVICVECTTQFDGINRCATCLAARLSKARQPAAHRSWSAGTVLLALLSAGTLYATFYGVAALLAR